MILNSMALMFIKSIIGYIFNPEPVVVENLLHVLRLCILMCVSSHCSLRFVYTISVAVAVVNAHQCLLVIIIIIFVYLSKSWATC